MNLLAELVERAENPAATFIEGANVKLSLNDLLRAQQQLPDVGQGEVVGLIGDIDAHSVSSLLHLIDKGAIIVPLTAANESMHGYFLETAGASVLTRNGITTRLRTAPLKNPLLDRLREQGHAGLVLFSSGSTGRPKAILHDFTQLLVRYKKPAKSWITLNFLLFDHIGGLNTLFHTLYNSGKIVIPSGHDPESVSKDLRTFNVELLPATPTFLRLWLLSGLAKASLYPGLHLVTYGTERMDQSTLTHLAAAFPHVDLRQTYGMSEMGILKIVTKSRDKLWIRIAGDTVEHKIVDGELFLRSGSKMVGYLNSPDPFDSEGWYPTGDMVETNGEWFKLTGRKDKIINVGGLKVFPAEVEHAALMYPGIKFARATAGQNPLTGMHVELLCEISGEAGIDTNDFKKFLSARLPFYARPKRLNFGKIALSHRYKQL